jgi:hypothetical protein
MRLSHWLPLPFYKSGTVYNQWLRDCTEPLVENQMVRLGIRSEPNALTRRSQEISQPCSLNTRSRSRSSTASRLVWTTCSENTADDDLGNGLLERSCAKVRSGNLLFDYFSRETLKVITWSNHGLSYALVSSLSNVKTSALGLLPRCRFTVPIRSVPSAHRWVTNPTIRFLGTGGGAGGQLRPLLGVAGAWALRMLPSAIMPSRWSCLSSQILNHNVMRLQQLARGVLDGGYCKLVGNLRLQNA